MRAAVHELAAPLCQKYGKFYQGAYQQNGTTANWNDGLHSLRVGEYSGLYWSRSSTDLQKILDDHQRADFERHRLEETIRVRDISNLFTPTK